MIIVRIWFSMRMFSESRWAGREDKGVSMDSFFKGDRIGHVHGLLIISPLSDGEGAIEATVLLFHISETVHWLCIFNYRVS